MTELILADEGASGGVPSPQATDIDALRQRFLPSKNRELSIDSFQHAGIEIIGEVRDLAQVLGELAEIGWEHLRPHITWNGDKIEKRGRWAAYCAMLWGCSRPTVTRAWLAATSQVERPQDMSVTTFYEILAGCDDPDEVDRVVDLALTNEWRSYHIRIIKRLQDAGLLGHGEWVLPQLTRREDVLYVNLDGKREPFARIKGNNRLARIGTFLLTDGAGIKRDQDIIEAKSNKED